MSELVVILKDCDRTYRQKFLIYEDFSVSFSDTVICSCIEEAKKSFDGDPDDIQIKIHLEVQ